MGITKKVNDDYFSSVYFEKPVSDSERVQSLFVLLVVVNGKLVDQKGA